MTGWRAGSHRSPAFRKSPTRACCGSTPRGPTRSSAPPTWCIAPEHPLVERLTMPAQAEAVREYCEQAARKSDLDRTDLAKEKTGVFTGSYAINPVNGEAIPIWVADYVLISYGTGAIMAVPAHDTRDFEFAQQFDLPIRAVVDPGEAAGRRAKRCWRARWPSSPTARPSTRASTTDWPRPSSSSASATDLAAQGLGRAAVNYKLRDWLFSRQHFWGEPFPILHELDDAGTPDGPDSRPAARAVAGRPAGKDGLRRGPRSPRAAAGQGPRRLALCHPRRQALQARNQHHAAMGRLLLVLPPLPRPDERAGPGRSGGRAGLDAGRSLRGRGRARRAAPALRPLLAQGALRPRPRQHAGAVPASWSTRG